MGQLPNTLLAVQEPQSAAQLPQVSAGSQVPLPQLPQAPQSAAQLAQDSPDSQVLLPQVVQAPQSAAQDAQSSWASHTASPQLPQLQSVLQVRQSSLPLQARSPQLGQAPQSAAQDAQSSNTSQVPFPQHGPQSALQVLQVSLPPQMPLPQPWAVAVCGLSHNASPVSPDKSHRTTRLLFSGKGEPFGCESDGWYMDYFFLIGGGTPLMRNHPRAGRAHGFPARRICAQKAVVPPVASDCWRKISPHFIM
jgi:hypothetical protein